MARKGRFELLPTCRRRQPQTRLVQVATEQSERCCRPGRPTVYSTRSDHPFHGHPTMRRGELYSCACPCRRCRPTVLIRRVPLVQIASRSWDRERGTPDPVVLVEYSSGGHLRIADPLVVARRARSVAAHQRRSPAFVDPHEDAQDSRARAPADLHKDRPAMATTPTTPPMTLYKTARSVVGHGRSRHLRCTDRRMARPPEYALTDLRGR